MGILIISAKLIGEIMHRINQPTILGNVLAGIIVGPALFAIVQPIEEIELFVSIGVFFLFFLIGLEEITGLISKYELDRSHKKIRDDVTTIGDIMYKKIPYAFA